MADYTAILKHAVKDGLGRDEALTLLKKVRNWGSLHDLMRAASRVRDEEVGTEVKLMGFVCSITPCTTNPTCKYCFRWANPRLFSWGDVLSDEELEAGMRAIQEAGLRRAELGGGTYAGPFGRDYTLHKLRVAKHAAPRVGIWVTNVSFAPEDVALLAPLVEGITSNLESMNHATYKALRPGSDLRKRVEILVEADRLGIPTDTTLMVGLGLGGSEAPPYGEWVAFLEFVRSLKHFRILEIHPFRPTWGSPVQGMEPGSVVETLKLRAVARLMLRDVWLSGAHTVEGLMAGANLIMHAYPVTKSFRPWGHSRIFASKVRRLAGDAIVVDNLGEVTRAAKELGFSVEGGL